MPLSNDEQLQLAMMADIDNERDATISAEGVMDVISAPSAALRKGVLEGDVMPKEGESLHEYVEGAPSFGDILPETVTAYPGPMGPFGQAEVEGEALQPRQVTNIQGDIIDIAADPLLAAGPALGVATKPIKIALRSKAAKHTAKVMAKYISDAAYESRKIDPEAMGRVMFDLDLTKYINRPVKLLEKIAGKKVMTDKTIKGLSAPKTVKESSGLIGDISKEIDVSLDKAGKRFFGKVDIDEVKQYIIREEQMKRSELLAANKPTLSDAEFTKMMDDVESHLKVGSRSLKELNDTKRQLGTLLTTEKYLSPASGGISREGENIRSMIDGIRDFISKGLSNSEIEGIPADFYYMAQDNKLSKLLEARRLLQSAPLEQLKKSDVLQLMAQVSAGGAVGMGAGAVVGYPMHMAAVGGTLAGARKAGDIARTATPGLMAKGYKAAHSAIDVATEGILPAVIGGKIGGKINEGIDNFRSPDSLQSTVEEIRKVRFPRSTEWIMENKELVKAKMAFLVDTEVISHDDFANLMDTLNDGDPKQIQQITSVMSSSMPNMFEEDKYGRWDGVVQTNLIPLASQDIMKDETLSNTERINLVDKLHKSSKLEYDPQKP